MCTGNPQMVLCEFVFVKRYAAVIWQTRQNDTTIKYNLSWLKEHKKTVLVKILLDIIF